MTPVPPTLCFPLPIRFGVRARIPQSFKLHHCFCKSWTNYARKEERSCI